jgi:hypothetical protein
MHREELDVLKRKVRKDKKYLAFKENVRENPNLQLPFESLHAELDDMHKLRAVRTLRRKSDQFTQKLIDAMINDAQYRSRCVEISASCLAISTTFEETLNNLRDYLIYKYFSKYVSGRATKEERRQFMESILTTFYEYIRRVKHLEEHTKLIINDIDQTGYTYRNLVEAVKLLGRPTDV